MDHSSASEGEILEEEEEKKATTIQPSLHDGAIDRSDRPRSLVSRSARPPQLDGAHDEHSGYQSDDYTPNKRGDTTQDGGVGPGNTEGRHPHGQKRRHERDDRRDRDYDDPRRFRVHYEGSGPPTKDHRSSAYYDDRGGRDARRRGHSERNGHGSGRYPDSRHGRSRSPEGKDSSRRNKDSRTETYGSHTHKAEYQTQDRDGQADRGHGYSRRANAEYDRSRRSSDQSNLSRGSAVVPDGTKINDHINSAAAAPENPPVEEESKPVDETNLIEERRKRREALRAKHRSQDTPLLQKVLDPAPPALSVDIGEQREASDVSTTVSSPSTPRPDSPGSPALFSVSNDEELVNPTQAGSTDHDTGDGPSAADYDPSMDMQEDKVRERHSMRDDGPAAATLDDIKPQDSDNIAPKSSVERVKQSKEFDMFAEDDDDDMFAPADEGKGHKKDDGTQAVRIPEAKQLDRSLLDDWDDPEGYYRIILGELLESRYHVQTNLGKGVFSAVVRALDTKTNKLVAIKVIRKQESMYKAGIAEIETLQKLAEADPEDRKHVIRLERYFEHKGHLCMVFENLADNLREVLKKFGRDVGINIKAVRSYAQQMFLGLGLLKKCEILHADLKPDNVLVNEARSHLKIADLGSAIDARDNEITDTLVSRFYRAPEIMLGIRHDYAIDMWSIGCTLFELYTGKILFTGPTNNQMLKSIMECRGKIPNRMLKKSEYWAQHFDPDGTFVSQEVDNVTRKEVIRKMNITRTVQTKELKSRLFANAKGLSPVDAKELTLFVDLLDRCLAVDPARRITPTDALKHGFINRAAVVAGNKI